MGDIIWIIFGIIYVIASTGRRSRYRNNFFFEMQDDISVIIDPLEEIRQTYNERLQIYYKHNSPKTYLINKDCEAKLIKEDNNVWFYVKERTQGKVPGAYFEVKGENNHVSTMWAIFDMEFNSLTRYRDLKDLYYELNRTLESRGSLRYYHEPIRNRLPKPIINKMAQNEFCRMEIETLPNSKKVLICSEIWGSLQYDKPRKFVIEGDKLILYGILSEFTKSKDKMQTYLDLLYKYSQKEDCRIREINDTIEPVENTNSAKKILEDLEQRVESKQKEEPEQILQVDLDEKTEEETEEIQKIKKYDERNIDL